MLLGIDLRHVPTDGSPGAGVSHASNELAEWLITLGPEYGIECVPIRGAMRSWKFRRILKREKVKAVFCASGAVPPFVGVPAYPWVHDVAIFRNPKWFPQSWLKRFVTTNLFLRGVRRAPQVFAVSDDTKRTLVEVAHIPENRISVTYQGFAASKVEPDKRYGRYGLIVGTIEPRKNITFIVDLWETVRGRCGDVKLVIAGKKGWGKVLSRNSRLMARNIEWVMQPSDAERDALIAGAKVQLLPSLYEGFGRSALEGMAYAIPVIASDRGAIPEVVGDAGTLLDPTNRKAWVEAIVAVFEGRLDGSRGPRQAAKFSWEKTARVILAKVEETC